jgi:hypothetical protein
MIKTPIDKTRLGGNMNMTVNENEIDAKIAKLQQESRKIIFDIDNFDIETSPSEDLDKLLTQLESLKLEVDDEINELEVEDFLLHGSRMTNKNI